MAVSLQDIARIAGVSVKTVSGALHGGQARMADITRKRLQRNKDAVHNTDTIIRSIEEHGLYKGEKQRYRPAAAREEVTS